MSWLNVILSVATSLAVWMVAEDPTAFQIMIVYLISICALTLNDIEAKL